jgi:hypothetical protein
MTRLCRAWKPSVEESDPQKKREVPEGPPAIARQFTGEKRVDNSKPRPGAPFGRTTITVAAVDAAITPSDRNH